MTLSMNKLFLLALAIISVLVALFMGVQAQASVVSSDAVDSITSSRSTFNPRENGDVTVNFSEKAGHEFQPGDVLNLTLPAELKGYNKNFMLEDYANVTVNDGQVRVVCTDKVAKKNHIHGSLWFGVHATEDVTKGTAKDVVLDLGTQCKNVPTVKVKGYDATTGPGQPKYAYKGGWVNKQDPTLIDWYIVVNPQRLYMSSDVFIRDTLGKGHELVAGSVTANYMPITAKQGLLSMGADNFALQLRGDFVTLNSVEIRYQTKVNAAGRKLADLQNDFTANFQVTNRQPEYLKGSFKVKNVTFDGDIDGDDDLKHAEEGTVPDVDGKIEEIPSIDTDNTPGVVLPDPTDTATETERPEVFVPTVEEKVEEEVVDQIPTVDTDSTLGEVVPDSTEKATETDRPEIFTPTVEEKNEAEVIDEIPAIDTDEVVVEEDDDIMHRAIEKKREEMQVPTIEETLPEESIIETEDVEEGKVGITTEADKATERVTETKPEQRIDPVVEEKKEDKVVPVPDVKEEIVVPNPEKTHKIVPMLAPKVNAAQSSKPEIKNVDELPKTSSESNASVALAGVVLLVGTVGVRRRFIK